jgi:SNF2 family DNA or RNA helicase
MKFLLEHACAILAADPGVGKTSIVYGAFKILRKKKVASKMLVIAPLKPCYLVWPKEQEKWIDFHDFKVVVLHGNTRNENLIKDADVCVINPEGLDWLLGAERRYGLSGRVLVTTDLKRFKSFGFDTLVVDELTKFKHTNTGRFKVLKTVLHTFARRWGLTGSLVANGLLDLFGQCYVIDMGRTFGQYITHYRMKYFIQSYDGFRWELRDGAEKEIYERLAPLVLRLAAEDYVDMPEVVDVIREFELPPRVRGIYDSLEQELMACLDNDEIVVASTAAVASAKCRQVANGGIYLDRETAELLGDQEFKRAKRRWVNLHMEKVDLLADLVEELQGAPLLVAYDFQHDLDRIMTRFGRDVPYIGGDTPAKRFQELEEAWNSGKLPLLLAHPQSVAHGLNLQGAGNHICWYSLTWNYELYDQFIHRIRRQGTKAKRVFNHHLVAKNTIDEAILWALRSKERGQRALYEALKKMRSARK